MKKINKAALLMGMMWVLIAGMSYGEDNPPKKDNPAKGKLDDVVVKEKDIFKIEREKPQQNISLDQMKIIQPTLETDKYLLNKLSVEIESEKKGNVSVLYSEAPISPWLNSIIKDTVATFQLGTKQTQVKSWELVITDVRGYPFCHFSGKDYIPLTIKWDGRNSRKNFIQVGNTYSYVLTFSDIAGNRRSIIGKPFIINAALHQEPQGLFVSVALNKIFNTKKDISEILPEGIPFLTETADVLKQHFRIPFVIKVYSESESNALEQAKALAGFISKKLMISEEEIKIEGYQDVPENFRLDVLILNRKEGNK